MATDDGKIGQSAGSMSDSPRLEKTGELKPPLVDDADDGSSETEALGELVTAKRAVGKAKASIMNATRSRRADGILQVNLHDVPPPTIPSRLPLDPVRSPTFGIGRFDPVPLPVKPAKPIQGTEPPSLGHSDGFKGSSYGSGPPSSPEMPTLRRSQSAATEAFGASKVASSSNGVSAGAPGAPQRSSSSTLSSHNRNTKDAKHRHGTPMPSNSSSREHLPPAREAKRYTRSKPRLPEADVGPAPSAGMYWSLAPAHGTRSAPPLRSHTASLICDAIWIIGGIATSPPLGEGANDDSVQKRRPSSQEVWQLDTDTFRWARIKTFGDAPPPGRSHTATVVDRRIFVFAGGDNVEYTNDLYCLDTVTRVWSKPEVFGTVPPARRAHQAVLYRDKIIIYGGGNGTSALYDLFALDISDLEKLEWTELHPKGNLPPRRGYHAAVLSGNHMVVIGGSDGGKCYDDIHTLNLETMTWKQVDLDVAIPRIGHSITCVGSYLFMIGGHDGNGFSNDVWLFNLVTLQWEERKVYGQKPPPIAYHSTVLSDSRLIVIGGYDERMPYDHVYCLDLGASSYFPQVTDWTTSFE